VILDICAEPAVPQNPLLTLRGLHPRRRLYTSVDIDV
jgi:hypothetical protein